MPTPSHTAGVPALAALDVIGAAIHRITFRSATGPHYMCLTIASANSEHFTSVAPSMRRAKS
jgi:hypothetical protein